MSARINKFFTKRARSLCIHIHPFPPSYILMVSPQCLAIRQLVVVDYKPCLAAFAGFVAHSSTFHLTTGHIWLIFTNAQYCIRTKS